MTRTKRSYAEMAEVLGIRWCPGIEGGHHCQRMGGITEGTVHLAERRPSLENTSLFLTLAARVLDPSLDEEAVMWRRSYRLALARRGLARRVHVRLPRRIFDFERTYVLAGVAGLTNDVPLRKQAFDWARR